METKEMRREQDCGGTVPAFLTIIVPAYNVERFLAKCLDSLLNQTLIAHKVIIVNDGSTDSTGVIAQKYAKKYPEIIQYLEQPNQGQGAARNNAMRLVHTDYVTFLDSDDWLMPKFVETIEDRIREEAEPPEIIFTLPRIFDMSSSTYEPWLDKDLFTQLFPSPNVVISAKIDPRIYALEPNACRRVYYMPFMRQVGYQFPEKTKWEDVEPHFQVLHYANRCIGESRTGFFYRINSGNQTTASIGKDRLQVIAVFERMYDQAIAEAWDGIEISYILRLMVIFMEWSINCSAIPIRNQLVEEIHRLYKKIADERFRNFYGDIRITRRQKLYIQLLRSPFYNVVKNEHYFRAFRGVMKHVIRKV